MPERYSMFLGLSSQRAQSCCNIKRMNLQNSEAAIHRVDTDVAPSQRKNYKPTNSYSQKPVLQQILTIILFLTIVILHAIFITVSAVHLDSAIFWILIAITYVLNLLIAYDYLFLTCTDPVDDLILNVDKKYKAGEVTRCDDCNSRVHIKSYHCRKCNRCAEYFDHHCKYLNNCIGGKNYHQFLRMLMSVTVYCLTIIFEAIWVFVHSFRDAQFQNDIVSKWGTLVTLILTFIALLAVDSLLCFHFYLIFSLKSTTLDYIMNQPDSTEPQPQYPQV